MPLNSQIPEETKFYFAGERVLMRSMFNSPFTNIQVGFSIDLIPFPHFIKSQVLEKVAKLETEGTYLIIVTDATDGVSVNFFGRCKFLQI